MTDRMSNIEIEDVLSSIRKLVSDDLRPGSLPVAPPPAARPAVPRLVLTQALRVHPDRAPGAPADDGLAGRLAELESLMARQDHAFEDDSLDTLSAAPEPRHPDEAPFVTDAGDEGAPLSWTEPTALRAAPDGTDAPSPVVDDAMMRALIRDVLREELQGDMGERVTRNLRKLVRAEIARALTARGLA